MDVLETENDVNKLVDVVIAIVNEQRMAHKTFVSYKYSESRGLRDKIIEALGKDATYYKGENVDSKDMSDYKRETIKANLSDMIYDTSVTIVILSPNMRESE